MGVAVEDAEELEGGSGDFVDEDEDGGLVAQGFEDLDFVAGSEFGAGEDAGAEGSEGFAGLGAGEDGRLGLGLGFAVLAAGVGEGEVWNQDQDQDQGRDRDRGRGREGGGGVWHGCARGLGLAGLFLRGLFSRVAGVAGGFELEIRVWRVGVRAGAARG